MSHNRFLPEKIARLIDKHRTQTGKRLPIVDGDRDFTVCAGQWFPLSRGSRKPRRTRGITAQLLLHTGVIALTGCATTAELEVLRAEVRKAYAAAARAEADADSLQRQLVEMRTTDELPVAVSVPRAPTIVNSPGASGFKWGTRGQD